MEERWADKVALITGANCSSGKCLAECLVGKGMKVIGIASQVDKVKVCFLQKLFFEQVTSSTTS